MSQIERGLSRNGQDFADIIKAASTDRNGSRPGGSVERSNWIDAGNVNP